MSDKKESVFIPYTVEVSETRTYTVPVCATSEAEAIEHAERLISLGVISHTVVDMQYFPEPVKG